MKTFSKKVTHYSEYLLLRIVQLLLSIIPRRVALSLGGSAGSLLFCLGIYRFIVERNMDHVALWDKKSASGITRALYRNIGRYAVDFLRPPLPLPPYRMHNYDYFNSLVNNGKGTIVILGHLGNWELLASVFGIKTGKLHVVAKPMNNPIVDKWLLSKRDEASVTTIYSQQALRKILNALKKDEIVAILIDQYMLKHGTTVPFLGKEAKTVSTVAGLALKTGCNVLAISSIMDCKGVYDISFNNVVHQDDVTLPEDKRLHLMQTTHNNHLTRQILDHPEHWFGWFHKRFRGFVNYQRHGSS